MAHKDRHAHAGCGHLNRRIKDFLGLSDHFPLFLGRPIFHEHINMRNHVEGDLLRINAWGNFLTWNEHSLGLVPQLIHCIFACARHRLVGGHHNTLDPRAVMKRLQRHDHLGGGTIGVRDNVLLRIALNRLRVHLRDNQRHIRIIAIERGVIDHDTTLRCRKRCIGFCGFRPNSEKCDIPAFEIECIEILGLESLVTKTAFRAKRFTRGKHGDLVNGELTFVQNVEHFAAHIARGADNDNFVTHVPHPSDLQPRTPLNHVRPKRKGHLARNLVALSRGDLR